MSLLNGIQTLAELPLAGRRVLVRADLDVSLDTGSAVDEARVRLTLPTLQLALEAGAKVIVAAHLEASSVHRPDELTLEPIGQLLSALSGCEVHLPDDCIGDSAKKVVQDLRPGQICLLENLRLHPEEEADDSAFAERLAELADVYVNDALQTSAKKHASVHALARTIRERACGLSVETELRALDRLVTRKERPYVAILGGADIDDQLALFAALLAHADVIALGGAVANTFLAARGIDMQASIFDKDKLAIARTLLDRARSQGVKVLLPEDVWVGPSPASSPVDVASIPAGTAALDVGPRTIERIAAAVATAKTLLFAGPLGAFSEPAFANGTRRLLDTMSRTPGFRFVLGTDSAAALRVLAPTSTAGEQHIAHGGRATLELLEGKKLPGIEALRQPKRS